jgi:multisubunit Na+/H+ antiporter MnhE subunit
MSLKTFFAAGFVAAMPLAGVAHANEQASFELRNISGQNIDIIQVSPVSDRNWGTDLLGNRVLLTGGTVVVDPGRSGCMFDVRVTYHSNAQESPAA